MQVGDLGTVGKQPLFADMTAEEVRALLRSADARSFKRGRVLFSEGERPESLHVLISGTVELYKGHAPHDCGLILLTAGDVFMPAAVLFNEPYLNFARTVTNARVLMIPADAAREAFANSHRFAINVTRVLAGQFRMATRHIIDLKCRTAPQRLAAFLLRLVDESGTSNLADLPVSKRHLASRLGMSPETLSRTLQMLAESGLSVRGTKVHLTDRRGIEEFCGHDLYSEASERALGVGGI